MGNTCCANGNGGGEMVATVEAVEAKQEPPEPLPAPEPEETKAKEEELPPPPPPPANTTQGAPKVVLLFLLQDGSQRAVDVFSKPLGAGFKKDIPLSVGTVKTGALAEELKIQPGWKLQEINGEDVSKTEAIVSIDKVLSAVGALPEK